MKPEVKEFYDMFPEGAKVLIKKRAGYRRVAWGPATVESRELHHGAASIRHIEKYTGHTYYTFFRCRGEIKRACEEKDCWQEALACCLVDYLVNEPKEVIEFYCGEHARKYGYCPGCGEFWGGVERFEFSKTGLCENCEGELDSELADSGEYEDFVY